MAKKTGKSTIKQIGSLTVLGDGSGNFEEVQKRRRCNFGTRLGECRNAMRLTKTEFAEALELNGTELIDQWESGDGMPSTSMLFRMARIWGIDLNGLLVGTPSAAIVKELEALREIKREFRELRNSVRPRIENLKKVDRAIGDILAEMERREKEAREKSEGKEKPK